MNIIDFHAHAFPDKVAAKAIPHLEQEGQIKARTDGTIAGLLASMDKAGIGRMVIASIATKPEQFDSILRWSREIASERIIPFGSVHPADPAAAAKVRAIAEAGLQGVKMHPYYQEFDLDEARMWPIYRALDETGLILLMHTGFDLAFERFRRADPVRILKVVEAFPALRLVASHMGAWEDWEEVEKHFLGRPICTDVSYAIQFMAPERARHLLESHPAEHLLFGSDSPWADQKEAVDYVRALGLESRAEELLLGGNARRLLGIE